VIHNILPELKSVISNIEVPESVRVFPTSIKKYRVISFLRASQSVIPAIQKD